MAKIKNRISRAGDIDMEFYTQVMVVVSVCAVSFGIPFAVYHAIWGVWTISLVLIPVILMQLFALYTLLRNGFNAFAAWCVAVLQTAGSCYFVYEAGMMASYWLFASAVANFYIIGRHSAIIINLLAALVVILLVFEDPALMLRYGASFAMVNVFLFGFARQLEKKNHQLDEMLKVDPLTMAGNRTAMEDTLRRVKSQFDRYGSNATLLMIDIDHFKRVNDTWGHSEGDKVLQEIAIMIQKRLRPTDNLFRYGGEEFMVVTENTSLSQAAYLAEDIRRQIAGRPNLISVQKQATGNSLNSKVVPEHTPLTVSIGVAQLRMEESTDQWVDRADRALYKAKSVGCNWVSFDAETESAASPDQQDDTATQATPT